MDMRPEQQTAGEGQAGKQVEPDMGNALFNERRAAPDTEQAHGLGGDAIAPPSAMIIDSPANAGEETMPVEGLREQRFALPERAPFLPGEEQARVSAVVAEVQKLCTALDSGATIPQRTEMASFASTARALLAASPLADPSLREKLFESARKLWNACVARANTLLTNATDERTDHDPLLRPDSLGQNERRVTATVSHIRECCCDLVDASLRSGSHLTVVDPKDAELCLSFSSKTAIVLHEEGKFDLANAMFKRANAHAEALEKWLASRGEVDPHDAESRRTALQIFNLKCAWAANCWHIGETDCCYTLLRACLDIATDREPSDQDARKMLIDLIRTRLSLGKAALTRSTNGEDDGGLADADHAVAMLEGAHDILATRLPESTELTEKLAGSPCPIAHDGSENDTGVRDSRVNDALRVETLHHLACANVNADKFAAAKNCVQLLRCMVEPPRLPSSVDFTMRYVSFLANVGLGAVDNALEDAQSMISHKDAAFKTCVPVLVKLASVSSEYAAKVVEMFQQLVKAVPGDDTAVAKSSVSLIEAILAVVRRSDADDIVNAAVELVSDKNVKSALLAPGMDETHHQCYSLIFNHGVLLYRSERFAAANKLFQCSVDFQANTLPTSSDSSSDPGRAQLLRLQARCLMDSGCIDDALATAKTVEELESTPSPTTAFLKLKILLRSDDSEAGVLCEAVRKLASFREPDYLLSALVAIEESQNHVVAATTAKELLKMIQSSDGCIPPALLELEMSVLRLRMYHIIEAHRKDPGDDEQGGSQAVVIGKLLQELLDRMKARSARGIEALSKIEGEYFSDVAWDTAMTAAHKGEMTPAAVCFMACARIISAFLPKSTSAECQSELHRAHQVRKASALLLTASCLIEMCKAAHTTSPTATQNTANLMKQASGALSKMQQTTELMLSDGNFDASSQSTLMSLLSHHRILTHELACISGDASTQLKLLLSNNLNVEDVLTMAENSATRGNVTAASRGFDIALTKLLAAPQRDAESIAAVIRHRIEIEEGASVSVGKPHKKMLELFSAATAQLSLLADLYPHDEAAWLVTTAFNLGVMNHRMHRLDEGLSMFEACKKMILQASRSDESLKTMLHRVDEAIRLTKESMQKPEEE